MALAKHPDCSMTLARGLSYRGDLLAPIERLDSVASTLHVARGENEPLIVIGPASSSTAAAIPTLTMPESFGVELYRAAPVRINDKVMAFDALVPADRSIAESDSKIHPRVFLADIRVPANVAAGDYIVDIELGDCSKTFRLRVFDVLLPERHRYVVQAAIDPPNNAQPTRDATLTPDDQNADAIRVAEQALRFGINSFAGVFPKITSASMHSDRSRETLAALRNFLSRPEVRYFRLPVSQYYRGSTYSDRHGFPGEAQDVVQLLQEELLPYRALIDNDDLAGKFLMKLWDEPAGGNYSEVAALYDAARNAFPDLPLELAEQPEPALKGLADIWTIHNDYLVEDAIRHERSLGNRVLLYANMAHAIQSDSDTMRKIGWVLWRYNLDGYHFWRLNWWNKDPWTTRSAWKIDFNKTGTLVYPGAGRAVYPSVRLLAFRDGLEDAMLLELLDNCVRDTQVRDWTTAAHAMISTAADNLFAGNLYAERSRMLALLESCS